MSREHDRDREDAFRPVRGIVLGFALSLLLWAILLVGIRLGFSLFG